MSVRVYLPATVPLLGEWLRAGEVPAGRRAHAVTERLRAELSGAGEEEWEYVALTAAAQDAVGLLADPDPPRRVVLAADVPEASPSTDDHPTAVEVAGPIRLRDVAAVHVDAADAETDVAAARRARRATDEEREAALERCLDHELGWYASQEIDEVIGLGRAREV